MLQIPIICFPASKFFIHLKSRFKNLKGQRCLHLDSKRNFKVAAFVAVVKMCTAKDCVHKNSRPFASCCEPPYESEAKCKTFGIKISFVCI